MTYDPQNPHDLDPQLNPPRGPGGTVVLLLVLALIAVAGVALVPFLRKQWNEADPNFQAKREAELLFRQREAELAATAGQMAQVLARVPIAPSQFRAVVQKAGPAVVQVFQQRKAQAAHLGPKGKPTFDLDFADEGIGSGVLVRKAGDDKHAYVITNHHVVAGAERVKLVLASERVVFVNPADLFQDPPTDLAVLRLDATEWPHLTYAELGDEAGAEVGDWVVAVGCPFGLKQSVTVGVLSAKGRSRLGLIADRQSLLDDLDMLQTDASINRGNSGGPLLDTQGKVLGINTAIFTQDAQHGSQGVGFAIPVSTVKQVFARLTEPPFKVVRGYLGIAMEEITARDAAKLQVPGGILVRQAQNGYPAAQAGMREGDVIVRYDGHQVTTMTEFRRLVTDTAPLTTVAVTALRRNGDEWEPKTFQVRVTEKPASNQPANPNRALPLPFPNNPFDPR